MGECAAISTHRATHEPRNRLRPMQTYLVRNCKPILVAQVLSIIVGIRRVDHREQEFLEQRGSPHHPSLFGQLRIKQRNPTVHERAKHDAAASARVQEGMTSHMLTVRTPIKAIAFQRPRKRMVTPSRTPMSTRNSRLYTKGQHPHIFVGT